MNKHQLFDEEGDNHCLYCQGKCDFQAAEGSWTTVLGAYFIDKYICQSCQEVFDVHYLYPTNEIMGFGFSCHDLLVLHNYKKGNLILGIKGIPDQVIIPAFDYDFTDRDALYRQLKLYLTFA